MTERWHVLPNDDIKPHAQTEVCKCKPRIEVQPNGNKIVVHNAWDGREFKECRMDTKQSVTKICDEMRSDEGYRYDWQAHIAMAFVDAVDSMKKKSGKQRLSRRDIHTAANDAADHFLTLLARA